MNLNKMTLIKKSILLVSVLGLSFSFTGCYSWFENKIPMDTETGRISLGDLLYQEPELTSLSAPTQVLVSQGKYSGLIKIHWDEVPYANSYRIERAVVEPVPTTGAYNVPDEGNFQVLSKYVYSNNFVDTILAAPSDANKEYSNRYYYRVSAENIPKGLESSEFTETNVTSCGWLLPPPASIEAAKGENPEFIEINWTAVPLANKYLVYRGEKENGHGMELLDTVSGNRLSYKNTLYSNEKGVEFFYKVCAVLSDGSQSAFTGLALGYSAKDGAPQAPEDIQVTDGNGVSKKSLTIKWKEVAEITGSFVDVKYAVYRTSSVDSIYTLVRNNIPGDTTSITDESLLKPGLKYYYYVQTIAVSDKTATKGEILKSPFSKTGPDSTKPAVGWLLSPPSNCEVVDSTDTSKYTLRWTPAVGYEVIDYLYNIYSSDTLNGEYSPLVSNVEPEIGASLGDDGYYSLDVEKQSFYRIATKNDSAGLQSDMGTTVAPCPAAPINVKASKTSSLNGKIGNYNPNSNGVYPVEITWSKPVGENPYGYYVYRSTKPDSSFRKITDEPVTDVLSFIDENETARAGTFYYYKVVSLNVLMQGENANEQNADTKGYGALTREQWFREYNKTIMSSQNKETGLKLMHKDATAALGSETIKGNCTGTCSYNASMAGLGARIIIYYDKYADFYINNDPSAGYYFLLTGNTNTTANMSANGSMDGKNTAGVEGMYPGYAIYDNVQIKGGAAAGGTYTVCTQDKNGNVILNEALISWTVGEE
jgi:hypothetical protein